jgi:hypothetical protein
VIQKRYDELKPGDVIKLSNGRTWVLVAELHGRGNPKVRINGYRDADPAKGVHSFSSSYLADREVTVYSIDEVGSWLTRLKEWGAAHGGESYTFGDRAGDATREEKLAEAAPLIAARDAELVARGMEPPTPDELSAAQNRADAEE